MQRQQSRLTRGLGLAPVTAVDASMTAASQSPVAELTVSVEAAFVTSSNVSAYCGAQASRWMRFCRAQTIRRRQHASAAAHKRQRTGHACRAAEL